MNRELVLALAMSTLCLILGGIVGSLSFSSTEIVSFENTSKIAELNSKILALENAEPIVIVKNITVEKEIIVGNEELSTILAYIDEQEGDLEMIYDESDSISDFVNVIKFDQYCKGIALDAIESELFDELDKEEINVSGVFVELDEDEMKRLDINDDSEDILIDSIDFEDGDITYIVSGTFEQDSNEFGFIVEVSIEENEFDDLNIITVNSN